MKQRWFLILVPVALAVALLMGVFALQPARAQGNTYYVNAATGNDSYTPEQAQNPATPWKTVTHAAATVPAGSAADPNVIRVAAGTYDAALGEVFPIVFANAYVHLIGEGRDTTVIDGGGAVTIIDVQVEGAHIEGFHLQGPLQQGINASAPLSVVDNRITGGMRGVLVNIDELLSDDRTLSETVVNNNFITVTGTSIGVEINVYLDANYRPLTITVGGVEVLSNTIIMPPASGPGVGIDLEAFEAFNVDGGTVTFGPVDVSDNHISGGGYGIQYYGCVDVLTDTVVIADDLTFNNNTLRDQYYTGIYMDYYDATNLYGSTSVTLGDLEMSGNDIRCDQCYDGGISISDYG